MSQKLDKRFLWCLRDAQPYECALQYGQMKKGKLYPFVPVIFVKMLINISLNHKINI